MAHFRTLEIGEEYEASCMLDWVRVEVFTLQRSASVICADVGEVHAMGERLFIDSATPFAARTAGRRRRSVRVRRGR